MLRRLVFTALGLSLLCMLGLAWTLREREEAPPMDDVRGAINLLPPPQALSLEEREQSSRELAEAAQDLESARRALAAPRPAPSTSPETRDRLAELGARLKLAEDDPAKLKRDILELRELWIRGRLDLISLAESAPRFDELPELPPFALEPYSAMRGSGEAQAYLERYLEAQRRLASTYRESRQAWETALSERLALQEQLRNLRDACLTRAYALGLRPSDLDDQNFVAALRLEADTMRVRLYFKAIQVRLHWSRELQAGHVVEVLREIALPIFALALAVTLVPVSGRVPVRGRPGRLLSWLILYGILWTLSAAMGGTLLVELRVLVYLGANLALYRAWRVLAAMVADRLVRGLRFSDPLASRRRIKSSITLAAGLWLAFDALETAIRLLTVGRGLLYWTTVEFSHLVFVLFYILLAYSWRNEVVDQLRPLKLAAPWMKRDLPALFVIPFLLPLWMGMAALLGLLTLLQDTESGRQLATGAMRRWLEHLRGRRLVPSGAQETYRQAFESYQAPAEEVLPLCDPGFLLALQQRLENWLEGGMGENRLLIVGRPGSGKSAVVALSERLLSQRVRFAHVRFDHRVLDMSELLERLNRALALEADSLDTLGTAMAGRERTVIVLEGLHQLFLSTVGGFSLLHGLVLLWRRRLPNVFWLITGGYHAQAYLNRVLDPPGDFYLAVPPWSVAALRKVILEAHARTGVPLTFDPELSLGGGEEGHDVESQFFHLLWELSGGNPASARSLWARSLEPTSEGVTAALPVSNNLAPLQSAPISTHLVLASIVRHEGLSQEHAVRATDLSPRAVRLALVQAVEWGVLLEDEHGTYRVHPAWLRDLEIFLRRKNMLYVL